MNARAGTVRYDGQTYLCHARIQTYCRMIWNLPACARAASTRSACSLSRVAGSGARLRCPALSTRYARPSPRSRACSSVRSVTRVLRGRGSSVPCHQADRRRRSSGAPGPVACRPCRSGSGLGSVPLLLRTRLGAGLLWCLVCWRLPSRLCQVAPRRRVRQAGLSLRSPGRPEIFPGRGPVSGAGSAGCCVGQAAAAR